MDWIELAKGVGVPFAILMIVLVFLGRFVVKSIWPWVQRQIDQQIKAAGERVEHLTKELETNRGMYQKHVADFTQLFTTEARLQEERNRMLLEERANCQEERKLNRDCLDRLTENLQILTRQRQR